MQSLWQDLRAHPRAVAVGGGLWALIWVLTLLTWLYDAQGYSMSMHPVAFGLQLMLPLAAGVLAVRWRRPGFWATLGRGALGGLLFSIANFALLLLWSGLLIALGRVLSDASTGSPGDAVGEALAMGLGYCLWGLIWGTFGVLPLALWRRARGPA